MYTLQRSYQFQTKRKHPTTGKLKLEVLRFAIRVRSKELNKEFLVVSPQKLDELVEKYILPEFEGKILSEVIPVQTNEYLARQFALILNKYLPARVETAQVTIQTKKEETIDYIAV